MAYEGGEIMNPIYMLYAKELGDIGTKIGQISNDIGDAARSKDKSLTGLSIIRAKYQDGLEGFKHCKERLSSVIPPSIISGEHSEFIESLDLFIKGTELSVNAVDLTTLTQDDAAIEKGGIMQKQAEMMAIDIADRIVKKLQ